MALWRSSVRSRSAPPDFSRLPRPCTAGELSTRTSTNYGAPIVPAKQGAIISNFANKTFFFLLAVVLAAGTGKCGGNPPTLTDAFDGAWNLTVYGDECGGGPDSLTLDGGRFSGTANLSGTGCTAGAAELQGYAGPGAGGPAAKPDFSAIHFHRTRHP